jgi:hypothetical protein
VRYPWRAPFLTDVRRSRGGAWCLVEERQRSVAFWIIGPVAARVIVHRGKSGAARAGMGIVTGLQKSRMCCRADATVGVQG